MGAHVNPSPWSPHSAAKPSGVYWCQGHARPGTADLGGEKQGQDRG